MKLTRVLGGLQDLLVKGFKNPFDGKKTVTVDRGGKSIELNYLNIDTLPAEKSLGEDGYVSIRDYIDNCCNKSVSSGVSTDTLVVNLNDKNLSGITDYSLVKVSDKHYQLYGNNSVLADINTIDNIKKVVGAGFNGVVYKGSYTITGDMNWTFRETVNIDELNASYNKIMYIEIEYGESEDGGETPPPPIEA